MRRAVPATFDLLLTDSGLVTTVAGRGKGTVISVPIAGGMAPGRVWPVAVTAKLGERLVLLEASGGASRRAVAVMTLVAEALRAAESAVVPEPAGGAWAWRSAAGPAERASAVQAIAGCVEAGVVVADAPAERLTALFDEVVTARVVAGLGSRDAAELLGPPDVGRSAALRWAEHVVARAGVNARMALRLDPPESDAPVSDAPVSHRSGELAASAGTMQRWRLTGLAIHLLEATTRPPLATAAPSTFGADLDAWQTWRDVEAEMLRRAWGAAVPDWLAAVAVGESRELEAADVLALVDRAERLVAGGFDVLAPGGLLRRVAVRRRMRSASSGAGTLRLDALGLNAEVSVDGERLTAQELAELAASKSELVAVRGRWVRLESADAQRLAVLARRLRRPVTAADLLADEAFDGVEFDPLEILPAGLRPARAVLVPDSVRASLRPYQQRGLEWLTWLGDNDVGGVLADDMGLGKTLQVLTWVASDHPGPTLVVCPVTLVDTWVRQADQFTPGLRVRPFHGAGRGSIAQVAQDADIVVTTYGLLAREESLLEVNWHRLVLDEAQAVKNPDTRAARAARSLPARQRIVVTGTPVENHLGDLWSLVAIAHPGLLPRRAAFQKVYGGAVDPERLVALRAVVGPFVLRRVKTDPGILPDLPDREVIRDDCVLTREQVGAYQAVVADMLGALEQMRADAAARAVAETGGSGSGARQKGGGGSSPGSGARSASASDPVGSGGSDLTRRAAVLAGLARLKQICVHPALLTESRRALGERGGKVNRLVELCGQIVDEGQAVVVFTQFASFVPDLAKHLSEALGIEVATLTGSDPRTRRAQTVARFSEGDGPPVLIASLKAGGTGLTLVRANHVIHLDRWWNPAVEDQASDRVWRIGQEQKVLVHVLVCPGTLEDRIDQALSAKRVLAGSVVRSTETAITELSDDDLADLVGLVRSQVLQ